VVNYEIPNISEDYVHRIGRTGRAGNSGEAVSLVCLDEEGFMQDIERFTKQNIEVVVVPGFEADAGERAEPLAMGRQTIWGGLGKPPSRDVMQAAAKAARSEMMTRIRENKPQQGRGPGGGNGGGNGGGGGGAGGRGRSAGAGNGGGNVGGGGRGPRQNTGYSQGGQGGQPAQARNPNAQPPRQQQARPHYDEDAQPASHVSSGFPSSGQPTGGNRGGFRGGRPAGGGGGGGAGGPRSGGGGGRGNGYGRSGGSGSFNGR
jgi:ATP-dependent RNA helicase RhlE